MSDDEHYATVAKHEELMRQLNDVISFNAVQVFVQTKSGKRKRVRYVEEDHGSFVIIADHEKVEG